MRISGEDVNVRARIRRIDSYSAHADREELHRWITARRPIAGSLFLDHGEQEAVGSLRELIQADDPAASIIMPQIGETYALERGGHARRIQTGRVDMSLLAGTDWQNDYADFATHLKQHLGRIKNERARREALAQMRRVLDGYEAARHRR